MHSVVPIAPTRERGLRGHPCAGPEAGTLPQRLGGAPPSFFHRCPHCPPSPRHSGLLTLCLAWPENPSPPGRRQITHHQGAHLPYAGPFTYFFFSQFSLIPGRVGINTPTLQMERLRLRIKQLLRSSFPVRKVSGEPGDSLCWNSFSQAVAPRERKERKWREACQPSFPSWCPEGQQLLRSGSWHW